MNFHKYLLPLLICISITSCLITDQVRVMQVEVMKPGIFTFPEKTDTIAILKRDLLKSDTSNVTYKMLYKNVTDSTIKKSNLSNRSVDALASYLEKEGYFRKVTNYRDSLNYLWNPVQKTDAVDFFQRTKSDLGIFLDYFSLDNTLTTSTYEHFFSRPVLSWTIVIKNDTSSYIFNQIDTLSYDGFDYSIDKTKKEGPRLFMENSSDYIGRLFGTKLIPNWILVERMYYKSHNQDMLLAEKYARQNEWLKAAEIWNRETKNKNPKIVAKACFNMALAAEMEGKHDVAIDWLVRSYMALPNNNEEHKVNCQRYINVLALRKKEIERLDKQVRNSGNNGIQ